jgi:DNA-binding NarL/FixJ family response regulator
MTLNRVASCVPFTGDEGHETGYWIWLVDQESAHRPRRSAVLTDREEQIVGLLAAGLSNRAIAQRLQLSERTVENHVSHVLTKTGHSSRAGVAAWDAALGSQ